MTMIRDTSWGASASSSASFVPEVSHPISICFLSSRALLTFFFSSSLVVPIPPWNSISSPCVRYYRLLFLLNHTINRLRHRTESNYSCTDERVRASTLTRLSGTNVVVERERDNAGNMSEPFLSHSHDGFNIRAKIGRAVLLINFNHYSTFGCARERERERERVLLLFPIVRKQFSSGTILRILESREANESRAMSREIKGFNAVTLEIPQTVSPAFLYDLRWENRKYIERTVGHTYFMGDR